MINQMRATTIYSAFLRLFLCAPLRPGGGSNRLLPSTQASTALFRSVIANLKLSER